MANFCPFILPLVRINISVDDALGKSLVSDVIFQKNIFRLRASFYIGEMSLKTRFKKF